MSAPDPTDRRSFARTIDAVGPLMDWVERFVEANGVDPMVGGQVQLVIEELFTNHVRHQAAEEGDIEIGLSRLDGGAMDVVITDRFATEFDPRRVHDARLDQPLHDRAPGGLGLFLVQKLAAEFDYTFEDGTAVTRVRIDGTAGGEERAEA